MDTSVEERQKLGKMTLDELADWAARHHDLPVNRALSSAEFQRRQTAAAEATARFTRKMALYMLLSVLALFAGVIAQVIIR